MRNRVINGSINGYNMALTWYNYRYNYGRSSSGVINDHMKLNDYVILSSTRWGLEMSTTMVKYQSLFRGTAPPEVGLSLIKTHSSGLARQNS